MPSEGHIVTVKLTICEFEDGHKVNTCDLFTDGNQDYIDLCGRVIRALRPPHSVKRVLGPRHN